MEQKRGKNMNNSLKISHNREKWVGVRHPLNKWSAFTLAEVLITLGIIGIVAAMTIPTLINNFQKRQYVVQLKNAYSTFINGFKLMAATEGVDYLSQTEFGTAIQVNTDNEIDSQVMTDAMNTYLTKYFKITESCNGAVSSNNCPMSSIEYKNLKNENLGKIFSLPYFQLADGAVFAYAAKVFQGAIMFAVDVNGPSGPNQLGRDAFYYGLFASDASIDLNTNTTTQCPLSLGAYTQTILDGYSALSAVEQSNPCGEIGNSDISNAEGLFCLDRIIAENWQMNY